MAVTYADDPYTAPLPTAKKRVPQPGDPDYVAPAGDPNAPVAPAETTATTSSTRVINDDGTTPPVYVPPENNSPEPPLVPEDPNAKFYAGNGPGFHENGIYYNQEDATRYGGIFVDPTKNKVNPPAATGVDDIITRSLQAAYGRAPTPEDLAYWRSAYQQWGYKDPTYFEQRLLGMGAGGKDAALYGQYAGGTGGGTGGSTFQGGNFSLADLSGIGAGGPNYGGAGGAGSSATPIGSDPFGALGGGTWVPGIGWYPTSSVTDEMRQRIAAATTTTVPPTTTTGPTATGTTQAQLDEARNAAILEMLQRKPPTAEDLANTPENQAYRLGSQRGYERDRAALAEGAQTGGYDNSGFFQTELSGLSQKRNEGEAGFLGQLAISRIQAQREDLQYAIDQARNSGQFDRVQALEAHRIELDAALRREQMKSTESIAANDLALREFLGRAGLDLDKLRLTQQGQQFLDQLGLSYDQLGYNYFALKAGQDAAAAQAKLKPPP